jgi:hypothetical protein
VVCGTSICSGETAAYSVRETVPAFTYIEKVGDVCTFCTRKIFNRGKVIHACWWI